MKHAGWALWSSPREVNLKHSKDACGGCAIKGLPVFDKSRYNGRLLRRALAKVQMLLMLTTRLEGQEPLRFM